VVPIRGSLVTGIAYGQVSAAAPPQREKEREREREI